MTNNEILQRILSTVESKQGKDVLIGFMSALILVLSSCGKKDSRQCLENALNAAIQMPKIK